MRIVADENIPLLDAFFAPLGSVLRMPGRSIDRAVLAEADVLLVRSVTSVTAELLAGTPVRFVGTCTIGTDHLDLPGLAAAGVTIIVKECFQLIDMVSRQREMVAFTKLALGRQTGHLRPVVAMKTVTTDHGSLKTLAGKKTAEDTACGRGSRTGGTGNRDDRMAF
jgi:phosphoglycerate dehydrogenase-like enzyme